MSTTFENDILQGLKSAPKRLPSKYFYDEIGDELFVQIMHLPEYYLTNCEMEIFAEKTSDIINNLGVELNVDFDLIELGAGDGSKTKHLLKRLHQQNYSFVYHPIDISEHALKNLENSLLSEMPKLKVQKQQGDYFNILSQLQENPKKKIILFLGSNIGNFTDDKAKEFISNASKYMNSGDSLLVGMDLIKPKEIVLPAYSDSQGITAQFNLNLLRRINSTLGANFDLDKFEHEATYDESEGIARSFIVSKEEQRVDIKNLDISFDFFKGEKIQTEVSRKYNEAIIEKILADSDLAITGKIFDSRNYFADYVLTKK